MTDVPETEILGIVSVSNGKAERDAE